MRVTMIDTDVKGLFICNKSRYYLYDGLIKCRSCCEYGLLLLVFTHIPVGAVYCATKAAVKMLSDGIRMDTVQRILKVTTIQPGIGETPF